MAQEGYRLVVCDYSQIELRIMAVLAMDQAFIEVFNNGEDPHTSLAAELMDVPLDKVTKSMRNMAKPFNFGIIYGIGAERMVEYALFGYGVSLKIQQAREFRSKFLARHHGVFNWQRDQLSRQKQLGKTRTLGGRVRYFGKDAHNELLNSPCQGTGADGLKAALWEVTQRLLPYGFENARIVHMVHDEIVVECKPEIVDEVQHHLEQGMKDGMEPLLNGIVPVEADSHVGLTWAEAK